jgi:hypothetical protein
MKKTEGRKSRSTVPLSFRNMTVFQFGAFGFKTERFFLAAFACNVE